MRESGDHRQMLREVASRMQGTTRSVIRGRAENARNKTEETLYPFSSSIHSGFNLRQVQDGKEEEPEVCDLLKLDFK